MLGLNCEVMGNRHRPTNTDGVALQLSRTQMLRFGQSYFPLQNPSFLFCKSETHNVQQSENISYSSRWGVAEGFNASLLCKSSRLQRVSFEFEKVRHSRKIQQLGFDKQRILMISQVFMPRPRMWSYSRLFNLSSSFWLFGYSCMLRFLQALVG